MTGPCAAIQPGNWSCSYVPVCYLDSGHDGDHVAFGPYVDAWAGRLPDRRWPARSLPSPVTPNPTEQR